MTANAAEEREHWKWQASVWRANAHEAEIQGTASPETIQKWRDTAEKYELKAQLVGQNPDTSRRRSPAIESTVDSWEKS